MKIPKIILPLNLQTEALFGPSVTRVGYADDYESSQLLDSCHEKGHDDTDQSDESKEEEEEEEEQGGVKKVLFSISNFYLNIHIFFKIECQ
ncbi:hypothetical protein GCK32_020354 [Trichostrongylus colubriformis]|uniref:Uncharacterized protein n=1 Tax=Trichostrongylus colubriformis TaxID=6319 RepID=A0AAN8FDS5_TRICO